MDGSFPSQPWKVREAPSFLKIARCLLTDSLPRADELLPVKDIERGQPLSFPWGRGVRILFHLF